MGRCFPGRVITHHSLRPGAVLEKPLLEVDLRRFRILQVQVPGIPQEIAYVSDEKDAKNGENFCWC